jgi:hypothetical protein
MAEEKLGVAQQGDDGLLTHSEEYKQLLAELYFRLEERDRWANHTIQYLLFGNGGAIALLFAFIGSQRPALDTARPLFIAMGSFVAGIIVLGIAVWVSGHRARAGRRRVRKLMEGYLRGDWSYKSAFFNLGTLKSKWWMFATLISMSFALFLIGIGFSAFYLWTSYPESNAVAPAKPASNSS